MRNLTTTYNACSVLAKPRAMLIVSLLLIIALLLYQKLLDYRLGFLCVASVLVGICWPTTIASWPAIVCQIVFPYLVIICLVLKRVERPIIGTRKYPLYIGKRLLKDGNVTERDWSISDWIVAVRAGDKTESSKETETSTTIGTQIEIAETPANTETLNAEASGDKSVPKSKPKPDPNSEIYIVRKAVINSKIGLFEWSKSDLDEKKYHLYPVGWATSCVPDNMNMSDVITDREMSPGHSCLDFALYLAIQMSNLKLYTYFSSMMWLRWHTMVCYALLILFAGHDGFAMQLAMINFVVAVEVYWLHLGTGNEEIGYTLYDGLQKWLYNIYTRYENVPVDLTLKPEEKGRAVVDTVIDRIKHSGIFENDFEYIRRIAWVESQYGTNASTNYKQGGIWQMDKKKFVKTMNSETYPNLTDKYDKIKSEFCIDWEVVKWEDLSKPLHGGLAIYLYMSTCEDKIPYSIREQAIHWMKNYREESQTDKSKFVDDVVANEQEELRGTYVHALTY